jgi:hypothetical protein
VNHLLLAVLNPDQVEVKILRAEELALEPTEVQGILQVVDKRAQIESTELPWE